MCYLIAYMLRKVLGSLKHVHVFMLVRTVHELSLQFSFNVWYKEKERERLYYGGGEEESDAHLGAFS